MMIRMRAPLTRPGPAPILFILSLVLLGAAAAPAQILMEAGARAAGTSWTVQYVEPPTLPLAAEVASGSGLTTAWARCQPGVTRARAQCSPALSGVNSYAYATFADNFHLSSPYVGTNGAGDFLYNLYLTGTMTIQANNSNSYATVSVSGNSQVWGNNGGMLSFGQFGSEARLYALGGEVGGGGYPMNNIFAGPNGAMKVYAVVPTATAGYYNITVRFPVRFAFDEFPVNQVPPVDDWSNRLLIGLGCSAWQGASSDFSSTFEFAAQNPIVPDPSDSRLPLEDWSFATASGQIPLPTLLNVACATGTGLAFPLITDGTIANLAALDGAGLPVAGRPATGFADGFFTFDVTGLPTGGTTELTFSVPTDQAVGTYFCYVADGAWGSLATTHDDGDGTVMVTLTDGGAGDDDATAGAISVTFGLSPEQPQAVWLTDFTARPRDRGVDLSWRAAGTSATAFVLTARRDGASWPVPIATTGADTYTARDDGDALAAGGRVTYELSHEGTPVGATTVDLGLPAPHARLLGVSPNPFNPGTTVSFTVPRAQRVRIAVHDLAGRRLAVLADADYAVGDHAVRWDGTAGDGRGLPSGAYVVRLETDRQVQSQLVSLVR